MVCCGAREASLKRICIVVPRYGKEIAGGAEQEARCYSHLLKDDYEVHVATTCAEEYERWENRLAPGISDDEGVTVHRFRNDFERTRYWRRLFAVLLVRHVVDGARGEAAHPAAASGPWWLTRAWWRRTPPNWLSLWANPAAKAYVRGMVAKLPLGIQEEFIRRQGPYSAGLFRYLQSECDRFDSFLFFTYLYAPTYFGFSLVPRAKRVLVPTLHDEPPAYLPAYHDMLRQFDRMACNSAAEQRLVQALCNWSGAAEVIGMPVNVSAGAPNYAPPDGPYILYCGRIDTSKGVGTLFESFLRYRKESGSRLKLVLTGTAVLEVPRDPAISFLGFVEEGAKRALMRNAVAFVHPSPFESLSIVLLESFLEGTPALVNSASEVMAEHCRVAEAGFTFSGYQEFSERLTMLTANRVLRNRMGENGRKYVEQNYSQEQVAARLKKLLGG